MESQEMASLNKIFLSNLDSIFLHLFPRFIIFQIILELLFNCLKSEGVFRHVEFVEYVVIYDTSECEIILPTPNQGYVKWFMDH